MMRTVCWAALAVLVFTGCEEARSPAAEVEEEGRAGEEQGEELHPAFVEREGIARLPSAGDEDWLAQHGRVEQSFEDYVAMLGASSRLRPSAGRDTVGLTPLGPFPEGREMGVLAEFVRAYYTLPVSVRPGETLVAGRYTTRESRGYGEQYLTFDLLRHLHRGRPPGLFVTVGVTFHDIYPGPDWNYLFGIARSDFGVSVLSLIRFEPEYGEPDSLLTLRSVKILAHEMGHLFGLDHCNVYLCAMNGSNHLGELDAHPVHLCPDCLRKLHHNIGFDVLERYGRIADALEAAGLPETASWYRLQIAQLEKDR